MSTPPTRPPMSTPAMSTRDGREKTRIDQLLGEIENKDATIDGLKRAVKDKDDVIRRLKDDVIRKLRFGSAPRDGPTPPHAGPTRRATATPQRSASTPGKKNEGKNLKMQVRRLQQKIKEMKSSIETMKASIETKDIRISRTELDYAAFKRRVEELESKVTTLENENETMRVASAATTVTRQASVQTSYNSEFGPDDVNGLFTIKQLKARQTREIKDIVAQSKGKVLEYHDLSVYELMNSHDKILWHLHVTMSSTPAEIDRESRVQWHLNHPNSKRRAADIDNGPSSAVLRSRLVKRLQSYDMVLYQASRRDDERLNEREELAAVASAWRNLVVVLRLLGAGRRLARHRAARLLVGHSWRCATL